MSGIPDYRGHNGSYHKGHKPMVHDQFISSTASRQRYWGRSMVGWKEFAMASPNVSSLTPFVFLIFIRLTILAYYFSYNVNHEW